MANTASNSMSPLTILQWNILGLKANLATLLTANAEDHYDILVLQENLSESTICNIKNYTTFHGISSIVSGSLLH